jgi:hypothetical protein
VLLARQTSPVSDTLSLQVWHRGESDLTNEHVRALLPYEVDLRAFEDFVGAEDNAGERNTQRSHTHPSIAHSPALTTPTFTRSHAGP